MKTLKTLSIIFLLTLLGCASTEAVLAEFDENADFDSYNTFVICVDELLGENTKYPKHVKNRQNSTLNKPYWWQVSKYLMPCILIMPPTKKLKSKTKS